MTNKSVLPLHTVTFIPKRVIFYRSKLFHTDFRFVYGLLPVSEFPISDVRRVRIFGFLVETLSPSPQCMRTPMPLWVVGLKGLKAEQV